MNEGRTVFAQRLDFLPQYEFDKCVARYPGNRRVRQPTARSTLAEANENRDRRVFADFAQVLIWPAATLSADDLFQLELQAAAYALAATTITVSALTIAKLYRGRWQTELFFKWIKQHLRIKAVYGTSLNAVRTQIWTAIAAYLLVTILKKRLHLDASRYTILQIFSLTLFEKTLILQALVQFPPAPISPDTDNH